MTHYIHDEKNNRIEGMSKEEIYALLAAAIQQGQLPSVDADTAFVTMFKSIVDGKTYKMAFCTQAQYNQLEAQGLLEVNAYYVITDDETYDDLIVYIDSIKSKIENDLEATINGINERLTNVENEFKNSTLNATATTASSNCTFSIISTTKNVVAKAGSIVLVEYDITAELYFESGFTSTGTAIGNINITIPSNFRPSIETPLSFDYSTSDVSFMTNVTASTTKLNPNGTMTITCQGDYSATIEAQATFTIRLYGTYTTL